MDVIVSFKSGAEFTWKNVKSSQVESVAVDIKELSKKAEERDARKNGNLRRPAARMGTTRGYKN
jgi:hypothetical protein